MSRLGDLLLLERTRQKLTRKQVARMCGISEGYLLDVEEGRRIIQDDQARRILRKIGVRKEEEAHFTLDEIAAAVDLETISPPRREEAKPEPAAPRKSEAEKENDDHKGGPSGVWLDALSSVMKAVPVMNAGWIQVGRRMVPIQDGKIEGANPEKVSYFLVPDHSMHGMRIEKDDLVLIVPQSLPVDGAIMLVETGAHRCLRKIRLLGNSQVLLQSGDREMQADAVHVSDVRFVGRAVRVEFAL